MQNKKSEIMPIKTGKQSGTYCFGCKDIRRILGQKKRKSQIKCLGKNLTVFFVYQINQDF